MKNKRRCLCKIMLCVVSMLFILPIFGVCASADVVTDTDISIGDYSSDTSDDSDLESLSQTEKYRNYDYVIDAYDVQINVNEDNTFDIKENITVYFNEARHGIYREIPLTNTVHRADGTESRNKAQVSDIEVSTQFDVTQKSGMCQIKIGSPDSTVSGRQNYTISYTYDIGADPLKNADEFYFNIVGDSWTSPIGGITFTINMPKDFDDNNLGFSAGSYGMVGTDKVEYEVSGNTVTGSYNDVVRPGESLTVRLELPEGYFVRDVKMNFLLAISFVLPIVFVVISCIFAVIVSKNNRSVKPKKKEVNCPYPPENLNSLEAALLYKGRASKSDVTGLLFYLASKGYIAITPIKNGLKKSFIVEKIRNYDGVNEYEQDFMDDLFYDASSERKFDNYENITIDAGVKLDMAYSSRENFPNRKGSSSSSDKKAVSSEELKDDFYVTVRGILKEINSKESLNRFFDRQVRMYASAVTFFIILTFIITHIAILKTYYCDVLVSSYFKMIVIGLLFITFVIMFSKAVCQPFSQSIAVQLALCGVCYAILFFTVMQYPLIFSELYMTTYITGIVCCFFMLLLKRKLNAVRTEAGQELYEQLNAFVSFVKNASTDEIENVIYRNPQYYSDVYAYVSVLCPMRKFGKGFGNVRVSMPNWVKVRLRRSHSVGDVDYYSIMDLDNMMNSVRSVSFSTMTSVPHNTIFSSSGGSDGFSSCGGDSGSGGGGGSW